MIGIVTPFNVHNYGSKLQAYAVQEIFIEIGYDVELIDYSSKSDKSIRTLLKRMTSPLRWYSWKLRKEEAKYLKNKNRILEIHGIKNKVIIRNKELDEFNQYYKVSEKIYGLNDLRTYVQKYSAVVVGSDQVWNPTNLPSMYTTLEFVPVSICKIAFSASFGVSKIYPAFLKHYYKHFLKRMNFVSVRELTGKKLCNQLLPQMNCTELIDPTLIINPRYWHEICDDISLIPEKNYCFCYFLGDSVEHREYAKKVAKRNNCKLIALVHFKQYNKADVNWSDYEMYEVTVNQFLGLIRNAKFVITDSFHGSVFATIFHTQFHIVERYKNSARESANSRIYNLLEKLDLKDRLVSNFDDVNEDAIDFDYVERLLKKLRIEANQVIDEMMEIMRKNV